MERRGWQQRGGETRDRKNSHIAAANAGARHSGSHAVSRDANAVGKPRHNGVLYDFGAAFPVDLETYGVGLLLLSTAFIWIIITTCIAFLLLANFSSFGVLFFAFTGVAFVSALTGFAATVFHHEQGSIFVAFLALLAILLIYSGYLTFDLFLLCSKCFDNFDFAVANTIVKIAVLHTLIQCHGACLLTIRRPVYSTIVRLLRTLCSFSTLFFVFNFMFLSTLISQIISGWSLTVAYKFGSLEMPQGNKRVDHCKTEFYALKLFCNSVMVNVFLICNYIRYQENVVWFPEVTQPWLQELLPRYAKVMKSSVVISVLSLLFCGASFTIISPEILVQVVKNSTVGVFEMFAAGNQECFRQDLVEEILVNGSNLGVMFDHAVSIFIHNLVLSFLYLGSTEVRNVIIFKIPGLFSDETGGFRLPVHLSAMIQYNYFATLASWLRSPSRISKSTNYDRDHGGYWFNMNNNGVSGNGAVGKGISARARPLTSRKRLLAAISVVPEGSMSEDLLRCDVSKTVRAGQSTSSIWRILMINSRSRFRSILEERVEAGVDATNGARVVKPLSFHSQLMRALGFLKIRNLARYDPVGLMTMLLDGTQRSATNEFAGNLGMKSISSNPFHSWVEIVQIGTATIDSLSLNLQLVSRIKPLVAAPKQHTYLNKGGTEKSAGNMTRVAKRAEEWMLQEKSLARRKIVRKALGYKYIPNWCRGILWLKDEWQEIDPVQTHKRIIDDISVLQQEMGVKGSTSSSVKNMKGTLQGNLFARTPSQISNALFADIQVLLWIIDAITEAAATAAARGHDGRADEAWKVHYVRGTLSGSKLDFNIQKLGRQYHGIVHQTVPVILCSFLECLISLEDFVSSPSFVGQAGAPIELEGNQLSRPHAIVLNDALTRGVKRIIIAFYEHLGSFTFPPEYATRIAKFARFQE